MEWHGIKKAVGNIKDAENLYSTVWADMETGEVWVTSEASQHWFSYVDGTNPYVHIADYNRSLYWHAIPTMKELRQLCDCKKAEYDKEMEWRAWIEREYAAGRL